MTQTKKRADIEQKALIDVVAGLKALRGSALLKKVTCDTCEKALLSQVNNEDLPEWARDEISYYWDIINQSQGGTKHFLQVPKVSEAMLKLQETLEQALN